MEIKEPKEIKKMTIKELKEMNIKEIENLSLIFNKVYIFCDCEKNLKSSDLLREIKEKISDKFFEDYKRNVNKTMEILNPKKEFKLKTGYRFAIGLGNPSFIENGFSFYPVYGIPYIPGSSIKGLTRSVFLNIISLKLKKDIDKIEDFLENERENEENKKEDKELKDILNKEIEITYFGKYLGKINPQETYKILFGTKNREGKIIYYDAFPTNLKKDSIEIDVINPHYQDYYTSEGKEPPADWYNPVPIFFMVLSEGTEFTFMLDTLDPKKEDYIELAEKILKIGLEKFGIGAKTRKGYGWFTDINT